MVNKQTAEKPDLHPILRTVMLVPAGNVASYGQIADLAGLPGRARLVGKMLGQVPEGINVPWYRIIRSNGQLAFPPGSRHSELQTGLLQQEGVAVIRNRVKMRDFGWQPSLTTLLFELDY